MRWTIFKRVSQLYRKLFQSAANKTSETAVTSAQRSSFGPTIIPRNQHTISRKAISENALKVLYRLNKQGYEAYLVGGCVRDLLLNQQPKDFDVATSATPEQVHKIFRNSRLVGRRFKLAHILYGREIIEVATFRGDHQTTQNQQLAKQSQAGMLLRDNVYGTVEEDARRRDFTINSLYYSIKDFAVRDYCNGLQDLQQGIIRLIGDPQTRYREDPVRMLRAIRFAAKLDMTIEPHTAKPIKDLAPLLNQVPAPRLFDEALKLLQTGHGFKSYQLLRQYQLFGQLFPIIERLFTHQNSASDKPLSNMEKMLHQVLKNTDYRLANNQRVNPAFLLAAFLWYPLSELAQNYMIESGLNYYEAFSLASSDLLQEQCKTTAIPRRLTTVMNEIWQLQLRLNKRSGKKVYSTFEHPKFKAAFDLLELRSAIEKGELLETAQWWDEFLHASPEQREQMLKQQNRNANPRRRFNRQRRNNVKQQLSH